MKEIRFVWKCKFSDFPDGDTVVHVPAVDFEEMYTKLNQVYSKERLGYLISIVKTKEIFI